MNRAIQVNYPIGSIFKIVVLYAALENNIIDENYMFTKDYVFASPSTAASVVMGKNANGRKEWN